MTERWLAEVSVNGEVHSKLQFGEAYEIKVPDPTYSTARSGHVVPLGEAKHV
jgi:hypothetical protein